MYSLKNISFLVLGILLGVCQGKAQISKPKQKESRPNFVIIMADDLDVRQLSCFGGKNIQTVHIDQLAKQGMQFNNLIASEAMCVPTRASLFTGLYPVRHGSYQNHKPVYDSLKSIGHYLGNLGYTVALTGKDHSTQPRSVFPFQIIKGFETNCVASTDDYTLTELRAFVDQQINPFCLFVMSTNPHVPWTMGNPEEFDPAALQLPKHWVDTKPSRVQFQKFLAEVRRLDNQVGDLMQMVQQAGIADNTVFIFLGEQGPQFPGGKWTLWDYGQRSGMIVRWPGKVTAKTSTQAMVQYEDIMPTLVDIAGGKPIAGLDGKSFLPVLKKASQTTREFSYGIHNNIPEGPAYPIRSIRSQAYKFIWNLLPEQPYYIRFMMNRQQVKYWNSWHVKGAKNPADSKLVQRIEKRPQFEFYDLLKDPDELHNLAEDKKYASLVATYYQKLQAWMQQQGDTGADLDKPILSNN